MCIRDRDGDYCKAVDGLLAKSEYPTNAYVLVRSGIKYLIVESLGKLSVTPVSYKHLFFTYCIKLFRDRIPFPYIQITVYVNVRKAK